MAKKGGQVKQLQDKLNSLDIEQKQQAIRRIIDAMTRGKDVSMLFMDVVKNMQTPSLKLKKLIYLYVMSYAKSHPDLAILGINTLRKDAVDKHNPFLRGLAVRTMGCIRIKDITQYLCDPLKKALKDQDPYVRKTGALCVPKLYQIAPDLINQQGFLKLLQNLLNDGNATVVSNAVASLCICSQLKGQPLIKLTETLVQKLLTAMNDCNQWGVVYILDTLSGYIPKDPQQAENIMQRVSSRLAHNNSAVALSSIRLIIKYMDYLSNPESIRTYNNKISAPLITMISRDSQISYLVLKTINLVLQKRPLLLPKQLKIFFVNYHDPLYVKLEKLEILSKIANNQNILMILHELKQCVQEVDVQFVRKAVRTMGRCAIKLQKMADKCVTCLWETLKTKIPYVVQQAVIVIRDIFRKYPNKYDGLLADICENLKNLDDPQAKASIVWIIGEYVEMIENADQLMANFAQNFKDQPDVVQHQILISTMKLYLHKPGQAQQILKDLFKYITKQCENPDLRDRGFIYWRLLSTNPKLAKSVILSERPLISDQSYTLQTQLLEKLIQNIGNLASVYCKQPEDFVKRLKDNANAKQVVQQDAQGLLDKNQETVQFFNQQPKENVSFANNQQILVDNTPVNLLYEPTVQQTQVPVMTNTNNQNLLEMEDNVPMKIESPPKNKETSLLDLNDQPKPIIQQKTKHNFQTSVNLQKNTEVSSNNFSTSINPNASIFNLFTKPGEQNINIINNISIPMVQVLASTDSSRQNKYNGLSIKAAFQREGEKVILQIGFQNVSNYVFNEFALKLNANAFKLNYPTVGIQQLQALNPGDYRQVKLQLGKQNGQNQLSGWPYYIDCALKILDDVFVFKVPFSLSVAMEPGFSLQIDDYKQISANQNNVKKQQGLPNKNSIEQFVKKLKDNNLSQVFRKQNGQNQLMSYGCRLMNGMVLVVDIIFDKTVNGVNIQMTGPNQSVLNYFNHALAMIANL